MKTENMLQMTKQITQFFSSYPHEEAVAGVADHIAKFWEKRMRQSLMDYARTADNTLDPITREAVALLKK